MTSWRRFITHHRVIQAGMRPVPSARATENLPPSATKPFEQALQVQERESQEGGPVRHLPTVLTRLDRWRPPRATFAKSSLRCCVSRMSPGHWGISGDPWGSAGKLEWNPRPRPNGRIDRKAWTVAQLAFTLRQTSNPFSRSISAPGNSLSCRGFFVQPLSAPAPLPSGCRWTAPMEGRGASPRPASRRATSGCTGASSRCSRARVAPSLP
jgi:hypothetical protein